jgi:3-deoxy-D-arabino-heptulosonate 7-phosphate (DAHP) synthase class II
MAIEEQTGGDGAKPLIDAYRTDVINGKKGGRPKKSDSPAYDSEAYKAKARGVLEYKRKDG